MSTHDPSAVIRKVLEAMTVMDQVRDIHLARARTPEEREKAITGHAAIMRILAEMLHKAEREADDSKAI